MPGGVVIRPVTAIGEFEAAVELQKTVWGFADIDIVPVSEIVAAEHNDGVVLGAFEEDGRLVGFLFSFVGRRDGHWHQYSRMLAVHPDRRGEGLGAALKLEQKRASLEKGYRRMEWTFDPLEARNAALNLRRLGVRVRQYFRDIYGLRSSQFDLGVPTDRYLAEWDLTEDIEATGVDRRAAHVGAEQAFAIERNSGPPAPGPPVRPESPRLLIPVPVDFQSIRESSHEVAMAWRLSVREASESAFAAGFEVVDFLRELPGEAGLGAHVLAR